MSSEFDVSSYNQALVAALRSSSLADLRAFAETWGNKLGNRGLRQLARASEDVLERRRWLMIRDRPDLADLHAAAEEWLATHPSPPIEP
ncbi:MAG TPA: hypothetical protein VMW65_01050 [Chloroflexota bacterium]|nr:hypothetical protein [Chloroflexota bacterium]